jgi:hypothetical protein
VGVDTSGFDQVLFIENGSFYYKIAEQEFLNIK